MTSGAALVLASNRGPVSFGRSDTGALEARRGGGGLVSGMSGLGELARNAVWVCAALSETDRDAAREAPGGRLDQVGHDVGATGVRMLALDPSTFKRAYNGVANGTLWFVHHLLYDTAARPTFDRSWARAWASYVDYNRAFALALDEEAAPAAKVLVQDYHLCLAPAQLRLRRPDLRIAHFSHTPWAPPDYFRLLPDDVATALLEGMLGADHVGFLTYRWAGSFMDSCEVVLGADVDRNAQTVTWKGRTCDVGVHPLGVDADGMRQRAAEADVESRLAALRRSIGDRAALVRVDRTELSKNIVRGLEAYRELLRLHPEWRERVVHIAFAYPSRHDLPEYREYTAAVQRVAAEIDEEFATPTWQPLLLHVQDDYARSLAAYRLADVLLVNPVRDGMNLVAKEGPVLAEHGCVLVLSREAGAAEAMSADALVINPFDVTETAEVLHRALSMDPDERRRRTGGLVAAATAMPPSAWLASQLDAL
jgi:trehalose 6-phosphate synthase